MQEVELEIFGEDGESQGMVKFPFRPLFRHERRALEEKGYDLFDLEEKQVIKVVDELVKMFFNDKQKEQFNYISVGDEINFAKTVFQSMAGDSEEVKN